MFLHKQFDKTGQQTVKTEIVYTRTYCIFWSICT